MKRFICLVVALFLILCLPVSAETPIKVTVDGKTLFFDTNPINDRGRIIVPLRRIFEELDAEVSWDGETKTAISKKDATTVLVQIDNAEMHINDEIKILDVPAQLINDRTLVPTRAVAEAFGCDVSWDGNSQTVIIKTPDFSDKEALKKDYELEGGYKISYFEKYKISEATDAGLVIGSETDFCVLSFNVDDESEKKPTFEMLLADKEGAQQEFKKYVEATAGIVADSCTLEIRNGIPTVEVEYLYQAIPVKQILFCTDDKTYCATLLMLPQASEETIEEFEFMMYSLIAE